LSTADQSTIATVEGLSPPPGTPSAYELLITRSIGVFQSTRLHIAMATTFRALASSGVRKLRPRVGVDLDKRGGIAKVEIVAHEGRRPAVTDLSCSGPGQHLFAIVRQQGRAFQRSSTVCMYPKSSLEEHGGIREKKSPRAVPGTPGSIPQLIGSPVQAHALSRVLPLALTVNAPLGYQEFFRRFLYRPSSSPRRSFAASRLVLPLSLLAMTL